MLACWKMRTRELTAGMCSCHGRRVSHAAVLTAGLFLWWSTGGAGGQSLQDLFTNRVVVTTTTGNISANNTTATVEPNEPKHGGKTGGHSMWLSWIAPADGIATFKTDGSTFDTLLSAYYFSTTNDTTLDKLREAARNDDALGIAPASLIEFGAQAGHSYEIAVDGYAGAVGDIRLRWSFVNATSPPPIIVSVPNDQAAKQGDPVNLSVNLQTTAAVQLRWRLNESDLDEHGTNIFIASLQPTNVGTYRLRVTIGAVRFFTDPVEIQINSDGQTNALARDKLLDSLGSPLIGDDGGGSTLLVGGVARRALGSASPLGLGVVRGYNGSQIFNTFYATADPAEPAHCGVIGGASYWLIYEPPTNGTVTLDTLGSSYDTVMEAYTYNGVLTGYQDLISLDCANDSFGSNGPSRVQFPVVKSRPYIIAVDGVGGAFGTASLNYHLNTNQLPQPPALASPPVARTVAAGTTVVLTAPVTGSVPLMFSWTKDNVLLVGQTAPSLVLTNVTTSANYSFTVTNDLGGVAGTFVLKVVVPTACTLARISNGMQLSYATRVGQIYTIEESTNLLSGWTAWPGSFVGDGLTNLFNVGSQGAKFYRVRVE